MSRDQTIDVSVAHADVKGRVRFRVERLQRMEPDAQAHINEVLLRRREIRSVQVRPLTCSILVHFDSELISINELQRIVAESIRTKTHGQHQRLQSVTDPQRPIAATQMQLVKASYIARRQGLSAPEVKRRREQFGDNSIRIRTGRSDLDIFRQQFKGLPVALLGASAAASVLTGGIIDAALILAVIGVNGAVGFLQERSADRTIRSLAEPKGMVAAVLREGKVQLVDGDDLVVGDLVSIYPGAVSADMLLIEAMEMAVDESAITGESLPVRKYAIKHNGSSDQGSSASQNLLYRGTAVTSGRGLGVVFATGRWTEIGQIDHALATIAQPQTLLQNNVDQLTRKSIQAAMGLTVLTAGLGIYRGLGWVNVLRTSLSLAVAAVPEGMPTISTLTLALGVKRMRERGVYIRKLSAVENLGALNVLCFDKTGTLTFNRMSVSEVHHVGSEACLLKVMVLCNDAELKHGSEGVDYIGSPTETALLQFASGRNCDAEILRLEFPRVRTIPRTEANSWLATFHQMASEKGRYLLTVKGSPEEVLSLCSRQSKGSGTQPLDARSRAAILRTNDALARRGLRMLGFAQAECTTTSNHKNLRNLTWVGLVGLLDPPRQGIEALFQAFHTAGIRTTMITGDQLATAKTIGAQVGLKNQEGLLVAVDVKSLNRAKHHALNRVIEGSDIFSRVSPTDKLKIIRHLQDAGKIVAMTGDGINDSPALKAADVGLAMGRGTDVAQEAADVVLGQDSLETMFDAIRQGRVIRDNLRKSIHFLLSTNLCEMLTTMGAVGIFGRSPLNPVELLWINLLTDVFPALAIALEPPDPEIMKKPPIDPKDPLFPEPEWKQMLAEALSMSAGSLGSYAYGLRRYGNGPHADAFALFTLMLSQILHTRSSRSRSVSLFSQQRLRPNPFINYATIFSGVAQFLATEVRTFTSFLRIEPLTLRDTFIAGGAALGPFLLNEALKLRFRDDGRAQDHIQHQSIVWRRRA